MHHSSAIWYFSNINLGLDSTQVASQVNNLGLDLTQVASQVNHLGYLAGENEVPANVQESVKAMKEAGVDANLLLHRVWWLMKP